MLTYVKAAPAGGTFGGNQMELMHAHHQWATRPVSSRFQSFDALYNHVSDRAERSFSFEADVKDIAVVATDDGRLQVRRAGGKSAADLSHWCFNQLSKITHTQPEFIRSLTPRTAAIVLNERLDLLASRKNSDITNKIQLFYSADNVSEGSSATLRSINTPDYGRVLDRDYFDLIQRPIRAGNWQLPLGYKDGRWGAEMVPSGAYSDDRSTFLFMVDYAHPIEFRGEQLFRGFFTWNTEVGGKSWAFMSFLFRSVCGNNIAWGVKGINLMKVYHRGENTLERIANNAEHALTAYANAGTTKEVQVLSAAMDKNIAKNDDEAVTFLRENGFQKGVAVSAVGAANKEEGGAGSLWNIVQGLTAHARTIHYADERNDLEIQAGKLLELVAA